MMYFSCHDAKSIFMIPQMLYEQGLVDVVFKKFAKVGYVNTSKKLGWLEHNC